ncbi:malate dehydrogenase [Mycetocola tolaasinivorans]|uniref:Malate dehydrogenase n=1 Tax=Mycetocola tolaasinivorans TaxID=76635 RepID=A0A3L7A4R0_9MICO|nr:malate dehydrogenase [Mycetocola tolaasinivorans]RLP75333.1 malate dehydrogenase [Mycetocola tolaasinivorans]
MSTSPVTIAVSGAGGNIGYALLFRLAAGDLLGPDTRVRLRLLEVPAGVPAAEGTRLELIDGAYPLLVESTVHTDPAEAFADANIVFLVGAKPRTAGMERADLLEANAGIFGPQGRAINDHAAPDVRVIVVGNPANTNALIAQRNAPDLPPERFTALTRLDHNRAIGILAHQAGVPVDTISGITVWGNHSPTQYPDLSHASIRSVPALAVVDADWASTAYIERVAKRGAEIIAARGLSSAASAASAAIDHMRDWVLGTPGDSWTSVALVSTGAYDVPAGIVSSFPARSVEGRWHVVAGLSIDGFSRTRIDASVAELIAERDAVAALGLLPG